MRFVVHDSPEALTVGAADRIAGVLAAAEDRIDLGLAGGSTPRPVYERLRDADVDWGRVDLWLSDERWVPHDHADSNGRMAAEALADHIPAAFHRPPFSRWTEPPESAAHYEAELRLIMRTGASQLVLLGMGDDGHTASLFPGTEALEAEPHRWFVANHVPSLDTWRLTTTPGFLQRAARVWVLVAGAGKAEVMAEVAQGAGRYPIELLADASGEVIFLLDADAAAHLDPAMVEQAQP